MPPGLKNVQPLSKLLPKGAESGKEFARIVDLLLYHDAKTNNRNINIFNDAAGDYKGLDSYEEEELRSEGLTGYQYKFYASPLTAAQRKDIEENLKWAASQFGTSLKKWILITPDDLLESATRKGGGDVTWFNKLKQEYRDAFEIEHWGHTKLQLLFINAPSLCLYYYPELVQEGHLRIRSIQETKARYDENLLTQNRNIEFVGMSIYKPEASRGIPLEQIYIPVHLTKAKEFEREDDTNSRHHFNPVELLNPGFRGVVLGDPGSGKSTLLKFLSLTGISKPLQERYGARPDDRLFHIVILRKYAEELKTRTNLSLLSYIKEVIKADFSIEHLQTDFLEYYLDTGKAVILFDGLDELPGSQYKETVRNRILSLTNNYPTNAFLVTSRIVGYDTPFMFDVDSFTHFKVAKLQLPEMERFVNDWYRVRVENEKDRQDNIADLVSILKDDDHTSIRELAENPLLLTIITLVHRIDAVLPDERVVLYQKCTETLLNTWQTWKFRDEMRNRGGIEKRNRRRVEVIAYWMHLQMGNGLKERSVVRHDEIVKVLTNHIRNVEKSNDPDFDADEQAKDFLDFIRKRAGLLIEAGDQRYSFVHLTFQEYLASSDIITRSEKDGITNIWPSIKEVISDPRWYEVIRLLIAGLKSEDSQEYLIDQIIAEAQKSKVVSLSLLLGGILQDGVRVAEMKAVDIFGLLISAGIRNCSSNDLNAILVMLSAFADKNDKYENDIKRTFTGLWNNANKKEKEKLLLFGHASLIDSIVHEVTAEMINGKDADPRFKFLLEYFQEGYTGVPDPGILPQTALMRKIQMHISCISRSMFATMSFNAAIMQAFQFRIGIIWGLEGLYYQLLLLLAPSRSRHVYFEFVFHYLAVSRVPVTDEENYLNKKMKQLLVEQPIMSKLHFIDNEGSAFINSQAKLSDREDGYYRMSQRVLVDIEDQLVDFNITRARDIIKILKATSTLARTATTTAASFTSIDEYSSEFYSSDVNGYFLDVLCKVYDLKPDSLWKEALNEVLSIDLSIADNGFEKQLIDEALSSFKDGTELPEEIHLIAVHLLLGIWSHSLVDEPLLEPSMWKRMLKIAASSEIPEIRVAYAIYMISIGDNKYESKLAEMVGSGAEEYQAIFKKAYWRPVRRTRSRSDHS